MERHEPLKAEILETTHRWQRLMDLAYFTVDHTFLDSIHDEPDVCAETETYPQYRQARTRWYLPSCSRLSVVDLEGVIVHELVHVAISPLESQLRANANEYTELGIENITRAILNVRRSTNSPWIPEIVKKPSDMSDLELNTKITLNHLHHNDIIDERDILNAERAKRGGNG